MGKKGDKTIYRSVIKSLIIHVLIELVETHKTDTSEALGVPTQKGRHLIRRGIYIEREQDRVANLIEVLTKRHDEIMKGSAETERQLQYEITKGERESGNYAFTATPLTRVEKSYRTKLLKTLEGKRSSIFVELYDIVCKLKILNEHSAKLGQEADKLIKEIRSYISKRDK